MQALAAHPLPEPSSTPVPMARIEGDDPTKRKEPPPTVCAIGNFDGVHRGHQIVLARAMREAAEAGMRSVALTFDPPPAMVLGSKSIGLLTSTERKRQLIGQRLPMTNVVVKRFDQVLANMTPRAFAESILVGELGAVRVVVGQNFRFGRGRSGDLDTLGELGAELGFVAEAAEVVGDERGPWSSSRVRASIAANDWDDVVHVLGRPHALTGIVVQGDQRGRTLRFPTANLAHIEEVLPPGGVFAVLVDRLDRAGKGTALGIGVANIGVRPTFGAGASVEVHLLDWEGDLYGARLRVHLVAHLRLERKFETLDALTEQIRRDTEHARRILASKHPDPILGTWYS